MSLMILILLPRSELAQLLLNIMKIVASSFRDSIINIIPVCFCSSPGSESYYISGRGFVTLCAELLFGISFGTPFSVLKNYTTTSRNSTRWNGFINRFNSKVLR